MAMAWEVYNSQNLSLPTIHLTQPTWAWCVEICLPAFCTPRNSQWSGIPVYPAKGFKEIQESNVVLTEPWTITNICLASFLSDNKKAPVVERVYTKMFIRYFQTALKIINLIEWKDNCWGLFLVAETVFRMYKCVCQIFPNCSEHSIRKYMESSCKYDSEKSKRHVMGNNCLHVSFRYSPARMNMIQRNSGKKNMY